MKQAIPLKKFAAALLIASVVGCSPYHYANVKARQYAKQHPKTGVSVHRPQPRKKAAPIFRLKPMMPLVETGAASAVPQTLMPIKAAPAPPQAARMPASQILLEIYSSGLPKGMVSPASLAAAYSSYSNAVMNGSIKKGKFVVVDFTKESSANRLAVVDFETGAFFGAIKVMHGSGSGDLKTVQRVSNIPGSYATPGGLLRICGVNGGSWEGWLLEGLEKGNSNSRERDILLHMLDIPPANSSKGPDYPTYGCLGVNFEDAKRIGLPVARSEMTRSVQQEWVGRGIYVYFPGGAKK
ncbi:MAG: murein L,D-transpeptidase catalytic domain-containing protein [Candidatus Micrarchaeia archaeon]|jgi:hypothetical protein